jgi:hypothetical protein
LFGRKRSTFLPVILRLRCILLITFPVHESTMLQGIRSSTVEACKHESPCKHGGLCISTDQVLWRPLHPYRPGTMRASASLQTRYFDSLSHVRAVDKRTSVRMYIDILIGRILHSLVSRYRARPVDTYYN